LSKIPSPKKLPLIHNAWNFRASSSDTILDELDSWTRQLGSVFHFTFYPFHAGMIFVSDPEIANQLLLNIHDPVKLSVYHFLKRWLGNGLFSSTGAQYKKQKKIIAPVFSLASTHHQMTKINKYADKLIGIMRSDFNKNFHVTKLMKNLALDVIYGEF
jgi:cytochrome P450 family 4